MWLKEVDDSGIMLEMGGKSLLFGLGRMSALEVLIFEVI